MKSVFPLLLCYVFMTAQTYAISGGPVFGGGNVTTTGIYSGVIQGTEESDTPTGTTEPPIPGDPVPNDPTGGTGGTPSNALGLFTLNVPTTLLAAGTFILFADGEIFTGTINASVDPDNGQLKGLLEGTFDLNITTFNATGDPTTTAVTASAVGRINARVTASNSFSATSLARLAGTANLDVSFGLIDVNTLMPIVARSITFTVTGFKQSAATS